jgi:hypothetical protein
MGSIPPAVGLFTHPFVPAQPFGVLPLTRCSDLVLSLTFRSWCLSFTRTGRWSRFVGGEVGIWLFLPPPCASQLVHKYIGVAHLLASRGTISPEKTRPALLASKSPSPALPRLQAMPWDQKSCTDFSIDTRKPSIYGRIGWWDTLMGMSKDEKVGFM